MDIKKQLYQESVDFVNNRFTVITNLMASIQQSLTSETKSSAGDKHETGRAMLQLEREKTGNQFIEIKRLQQILQRIDLTNISKNACLGSLVTTTNGIYFLAIGRGIVKLEENDYFVIALNSPIGKLLLGKTKGDIVNFNQKDIEILAIN